jgi:1,4-dihydroxy-2-naphthoyl-CoA hydrolase
MPIRSPFDELVGTQVVEAGPDRAVAELPVTPSLHQPGGIVHGGVYCVLAELAASVGANTWLAGEGVAVGTSNHTDFLRAVRTGLLRAEATPLQRGGRLQLWQIDIRDQDGNRVAHGKVKLMNVDDTPG